MWKTNFLNRVNTIYVSSLEQENKYRQISNISCTKFKNLYVSRPILQLSLPNPLKPGVKWRMKM